MLFISRYRSPSFVMIQASREVIETNVGKIVNNRPPVVIKFEPFRGAGFQTTMLPQVGGKRVAKGFYNTEKDAKKLVRKGVGFFEGDRDVTEERLISFLFNHDQYGREFVAVGTDGEEVTEEDQVFIPEGDEGGYFCTVCDKHLASVQAKEGHKTTSKKHKENFENRFSKLRQELYQRAG